MTTTPTRRERHAASRLLTALDRVITAAEEARRARDLLAGPATHDHAADEPADPYYIARFREIAASETTLPHVREAITSALAAYDARRAVT